jgi:hypothetical protein
LSIWWLLEVVAVVVHLLLEMLVLVAVLVDLELAHRHLTLLLHTQ